MKRSQQESKVKILAMYLPQFHQIPDNDLFWGEGFTDWIAVKNAKPLFEGHQQPRVPLNNNYYDLSIKENVAWQAKLAKEYGLYGFGIYHYWFNNEKNLLTKPAQIILENKDIDINFFFSWDNISWKRSWSNVKGGNAWAPAFETNNLYKGPEILIPYILGKEPDWKNHFNYLLPFFKDGRYIKRDNKPVFMILHYNKDIAEMCDYWNNLSKNEGFDGMFFIYRFAKNEHVPSDVHTFKYEPIYSGWTSHNLWERIQNKVKREFLRNGPRMFSYDVIWKHIIKSAKEMSQPYVFHGAFVSYDDTPRRGRKGIVVNGASPLKFKKNLSLLKSISESQGKEFIFLTAWNEWGEGAYLEPDSKSQFEYLRTIQEL